MPNYQIGCHPGAVWKKTDFQIHTPRDPNWENTDHLPGGTTESEQARLDWASSFIDACIDKGLSAIAVTDHHDMCLVSYVRQVAEQRGLSNVIWVFPGMEITCDDSSQCIVIFDVAFDLTLSSRMFGTGILRNVEPTSNNEAVTRNAELCGNNLENIIDGVSSDSILSPQVIILPHGGKDGSHKTVMRTGFHERFKNLACDGVYCEHSYERYKQEEPGTLRIIHGEIEAWGTRRRGILTTGDNRSAHYENLGINPCWIRLGEPTAEAIRQALLADEARIVYQEPTLPTQRVLSLKISSALCGSDFQLTFNDGFNSIIGGRGAGKSAILEYLRFGLGRSNIDLHSEEGGDIRGVRLINDTLKGGSVSVEIERDGIIETWTRQLESASQIEVTSGDGEVDHISSEVAHERFRARAYNQKQLSSLISSSRSAEEQITGIAVAEFIDERRELESKLYEAQRKIDECLRGMMSLWIAEKQHAKTNSEIADLKKRISSVKKQLEQGGLSKEHQEILSLQPVFSRSNSYIHAVKNEIDANKNSLTELAASLFEDISAPELPEDKRFDEIRKIAEATTYVVQKLSKVFAEADKELSKLDAIVVEREKTFSIKGEEFQKEYDEAQTHQEKLSGLIELQSNLSKELTEAESKLEKISKDIKSSTPYSTALDDAKKYFSKLLDERVSLLTGAADKVTSMSEELLLASVEMRRLPNSMTEALSEVGAKAKIQNLEDRTIAQIEAIASGSLEERWSELCDTLVSILKSKTPEEFAHPTMSGEKDSPQETLKTKMFGGLTDQQAQEVYDRLDLGKVSKAICASSEPYISFSYQDGENYIPFEQASPGQQAAALLELLLNQEAGTLIIDQPEDDLDNKIVMKIADLLQVTKSHRQLIFATHNPNLVVNGDSDKIIALKSITEIDGQSSPRISVETDGAIETNSVRDAITEIMEGGREAFELRRRKYHFTD